MRDTNSLRFYVESAGSKLRSALSRALDRGIPWREIESAGLTSADESNADAVVAQLDQLKPMPASAYVELETPSGPMLDEKRQTWQQLNSKFQD